MNVMANMRYSRNLALVDSRISMLRILELQRPVFASGLMHGPESLVVGICIWAYRQ